MEAARNAVHKITGKTGHRTDVDESVRPAVISETVKPHRHEETTEAIDREVHQHHYHTTVQPITHKETLPEKHTHNLAPQIEREHRQNNEDETHRRVQTELGQFKNTSTTHEHTHSSIAAPQAVGEHVHHHVHETVQPVIHKETVQPEVVHTTVPVHEIHHQSAQHHGISALPMKTLGEFQQAGGVITGGNKTTHEEYEGAPRPYNDKLKTTIDKVLPGHHSTTNTSSTTGTHHNGAVGDSYRPDSGVSGVGHQSSNVRDNEFGNQSSNLKGNGYGHDSSNVRGTDGLPTTGTKGSGLGSESRTKPSLMDKLNPKVDSNGDGKAGFMK